MEWTLRFIIYIFSLPIYATLLWVNKSDVIIKIKEVGRYMMGQNGGRNDAESNHHVQMGFEGLPQMDLS